MSIYGLPSSPSQRRLVVGLRVIAGPGNTNYRVSVVGGRLSMAAVFGISRGMTAQRAHSPSLVREQVTAGIIYTVVRNGILVISLSIAALCRDRH